MIFEPWRRESFEYCQLSAFNMCLNDIAQYFWSIVDIKKNDVESSNFPV